MANNNPEDEEAANLHQPGDIVPAPQNLAANLIRGKIDSLYTEEPDAFKEEAEVSQTEHRSKHQQFMYELSTSGKDLVQIQTEWHNYYQALSDDEKREVWDEFYASNRNLSSQPAAQPEQQAQQLASHVNERAVKPRKPRTTPPKPRQAPQKLTWKHHLQSALFGLSMGAVVVFILLFSFFNQVIIAPFIQPSRTETATPIILGTDTIAPSKTPEVIIPKINVEIPVDYNVNTTNENVIENDLEGGVIHYPTTALPGQLGNTSFFGHSSNNILNPGKYKFAFVLLHDLVPGDVFYLTYNNTVYAYKVFSTRIVSPNDVNVLNPIPGHSATATLITCDPPGTSLNRLIVSGDQISPNPSGDTQATPTITTASANNITQLPGNGPSLWHRFISTIFGKLISVAFIISIILLIIRWYRKEFKTKTN